MNTAGLCLRYGIWHYTRAISDLVRHIRRFAWFLFHFFSIGILLRTFFAPWKRMNLEKSRVYSVGTGTVVPQSVAQSKDGFLDRLIVNTIMRIVGMLVRGVVISFGLLCIVAELAFGIFLLLLWVLAPFIIAAGAAQGIRLLLS